MEAVELNEAKKVELDNLIEEHKKIEEIEHEQAVLNQSQTIQLKQIQEKMSETLVQLENKRKEIDLLGKENG